MNKELKRHIEMTQADGQPMLSLNISQAASYVKEALKGKGRLKANENSKKRRKFYHQIHWLKVGVVGIYMSIAVFEKPSWCEDLNYNYTCEARLENGEIATLPMSNLPKFPQVISHSIELFCIVFLAAIVIYRMSFIVESPTAKLRRYCILLLIVVSVIDNIQVIMTFDRVFVAHFIRPLLFILFVRAVRESFRKIYLVVKDAFPVLLLIIGHVLFFGWLGALLFENSPEFSTISTSIWTSFILLTITNFPDIMLRMYSESQ